MRRWAGGGEAVNWFAVSSERTRLYVMMTAERQRPTGVDRTFDPLVAFAAGFMPEGALDGVWQAGPIVFSPKE